MTTRDDDTRLARPARREVWQCEADGRKVVIRGPQHAAQIAAQGGWVKVCGAPHEDGDFSYLCGRDYCRCMA